MTHSTDNLNVKDRAHPLQGWQDRAIGTFTDWKEAATPWVNRAIAQIKPLASSAKEKFQQHAPQIAQEILAETAQGACRIWNAKGEFFSHLLPKYADYHLLNPAEPPIEALNSIKGLAEKGLHKASEMEVAPKPEARQFKKDLDQTMEERKPLKAAENWAKEEKRHQADLIKKASAFCALRMMYSVCKLEHTKTDLTLISLAHKVSNGASLWRLFNDSYKLSLVQKLKAAVIYWLAYQTSLISTFVDFLLGKFIEQLTDDFAKEDSDLRSLIFTKLLKHSRDFLEKDIDATSRFAYQQGSAQDRERLRSQAVDQYLDSSMLDLCKHFTDRWIEKVWIPFFKTFQEVPVFGRLFKHLEDILNRALIQPWLKSSHFDKMLHTAIETGIEATESNNLPFYTKLTQFLNKQLDKGLEELEKNEPSAPLTELPGTGELADVIKKLRTVLDLELIPSDQHEQLKKEIQSSNKWFWERAFNNIIEKSLTEGGHRGIVILNETAKTRELSASLLESISEAFDIQNKSREALIAEYNQEKAQFKAKSDQISEKVVDLGIQKGLNGDSPEHIKMIAEESFCARQVIAKETIDRLSYLNQQMLTKIEASAQAPLIENNIQEEIASFFKIMETFATRKEVVNQIQNLEPVNRYLVWRTFTPIYEQAAHIETRVLRLQDLQNDHTFYTSVTENLRSITHLFAAIRQEFDTAERHSQNPLIEDLITQIEKLKKLTENTPAIIDSKKITQLKDIANQLKILDAIHTLYPPALESGSAKRGLLEQVCNSWFFNRDTNLAKINKCLECFPIDQKLQLILLIGNKGADFRKNEKEIANVLGTVFSKCCSNFKKENHLWIEEGIHTASSALIQEALNGYTDFQKNAQQNMKAEMDEISRGIEDLQEKTKVAEFHFPEAISVDGSKAAVGYVSTAMGLAAWASGFGPSVAVTSALVSSIGFTYLSGTPEKTLPKEDREKATLKSLGYAIALGGGTAALSHLVPGFAPAVAHQLPRMAGASIVGWNAVKAALPAVQTYAENRLKKFIHSGHQLLHKPFVHIAGITRLFKETSKPSKT